jgi:hypothetical protein
LQASGSGSKSKKKEAEKVPEIDENLWKQTQMTVTNWADCDDDDDFDTLAPPPADWVKGGELQSVVRLQWCLPSPFASNWRRFPFSSR